MKLSQLLCLLILLPTVAFAQAINIPRNVEAGSIDEQVKSRQQPAPPTGIAAQGYTPLAVPQGVDKIHFVLNKVTIEGVHHYPLDRFAPFYADKIGTNISLADMYVLADRIRQVYHEDGFILTQVFLPEQDIKGGRVLIRVTEGYVSQVRWEGDKLDDSLAQNMAQEITRRPFDSKTLEDVMLRINELPGITATSALEPLSAKGADEGAVGIVITLQRKRVSGTVSIDDYASRYLGVWQGTARADGFGLFTQLDRLSFTGSSSYDPARLRYGMLQYAIPIDESGTSLSIDESISDTHPGFRLAPLDIFSHAHNFNAGITQPLWRSREDSLNISGMFGIHNQQTDVFSRPFSEDRLRTLTFSTAYSLIDNWAGANMLNLDIVHGLNILGATETGSPTLSRAQGRSDFTKFTFNASRLQNINDTIGILFSTTGQKANASLLSSEQFGFGGSLFGRGYDSSEITGDEGIAGSVELRWQTVWKTLALQPFVFYDIGVAKDKQPLAKAVSAASAGIGTRVQWNILHLDTNIAWPLTYTPSTPKLGATGKDPRINLSIGLSF